MKVISKSHLVNADLDILDTVKIHYVGTLANGKKVPFTISLLRSGDNCDFG